MIDFTTSQLSWVLIGAISIGGTGYMSMNQKIDNLSEKVSVANANIDNTNKTIDQMRKQLERIENKIDNQKR